jgi:predicted transposase/invertase (TIGR01784 family)
MEKGLEKGMEKGMEKGLEKGKQEGKLEAILNAHAAGLGIPLIARIVDMPAEEVRRILKEQGKDIEG